METFKNLISEMRYNIDRLDTKRIKLFLLVFIIFSFFSFNIATAATFSFSSLSGTYEAGSSISVDVLISSLDEAAGSVSGLVSFPKNLLLVSSVSKNGSVVDHWLQEPSFSNVSGTINFEGVFSPSGFVGNSVKILTINFKTKSKGTVNIDFIAGAILSLNDISNNILVHSGGASFNISGVVKTEPAKVDKPNIFEEPQPIPVTHIESGNLFSIAINNFYDEVSLAIYNVFDWVYIGIANIYYWIYVIFINIYNWVSLASTALFNGMSLGISTLLDWIYIGIANIYYWISVLFINIYNLVFSGASSLFHGVSLAISNVFDWVYIGIANIYYWIYVIFINIYNLVFLGGYVSYSLVLKCKGNILLIINSIKLSHVYTLTILLFILILGRVWYKTLIVKNKLTKEVYEAESALRKAFVILKGSIGDQVKVFEKIKTKRKLNLEEKVVSRQLKKDLNDAEKYIGKEIGDIENWYNFFITKKKFKKEVHEAEKALDKAFDILRKSAKDQINALEEIKTKRQLSTEEEIVNQQLKKDLKDAEKYIGKEIEDIEKLIKK